MHIISFVGKDKFNDGSDFDRPFERKRIGVDQIFSPKHQSRRLNRRTSPSSIMPA